MSLRIRQKIFFVFFVLFYFSNNLYFQLRAIESEPKNENIFAVDIDNNKDSVSSYNNTFPTHNTRKTLNKNNSDSDQNNDIVFFCKDRDFSKKLVIQEVTNIQETKSFINNIKNESIRNLRTEKDEVSSCTLSIFDLPRIYAEELEKANNTDNINNKQNKINAENAKLLPIHTLEFMFKLGRKTSNNKDDDNLLLNQLDEIYMHQLLTIKTVTQICITQLNLIEQDVGNELSDTDIDIEECLNGNSKHKAEHSQEENKKKVKITKGRYLPLLITFENTEDIVIIGSDELYIQLLRFEKDNLKYVVLQAFKSDNKNYSNQKQNHDNNDNNDNNNNDNNSNNNNNVAVNDVETGAEENNSLKIKLHFINSFSLKEKDGNNNQIVCETTKSKTFNFFFFTFSENTINTLLNLQNKDEEETEKNATLKNLTKSNVGDENNNDRLLQTRFGSTGVGYSTGIFFNRNDMNTINNLSANNPIGVMTLHSPCQNTRYVCQINSKMYRNGIMMGGALLEKNYM